MDVFLANLIPNAMQFIEEYVATKGADALLSLLVNRNQASMHSVETQFIQCLDTRAEKT